MNLPILVPSYEWDHIVFVFLMTGFFHLMTDFPGGSDGKIVWLQCGRSGFDSWVEKIPLEKEMTMHSSTLAWTIPWMDGGAW